MPKNSTPKRSTFLEKIKSISPVRYTRTLTEPEDVVDLITDGELLTDSQINGLLLWKEHFQLEGLSPAAKFVVAPRSATDADFDELLTASKHSSTINLTEFNASIFTITVWQLEPQNNNLQPGCCYSFPIRKAVIFNGGPSITSKFDLIKKI